MTNQMSEDEINNQIYEDEEYVYAPIPRRPEKKSKANTYLQLIIETYLPYFVWSNETLFQDQSLLYLKASLVAQKYSDTKVRVLLDWAKGKNLHIKQFIKVLNKVMHS
jgi:hypothetical protein